jgi:hypothetical protein
MASMRRTSAARPGSRSARPSSRPARRRTEPPRRDRQARDIVDRSQTSARASGSQSPSRLGSGMPRPSFTRKTVWGATAAVVIPFLVAFLVTDAEPTGADRRSAEAGHAVQAGSGEASPPAAPRLAGVAPLPALAARPRPTAVADEAQRRPIATPAVVPTPTETAEETQPPPAQPRSQAPPAPPPAPPTATPRPTVTPQPAAPPSGTFDSSGEQSESPP